MQLNYDYCFFGDDTLCWLDIPVESTWYVINSCDYCGFWDRVCDEFLILFYMIFVFCGDEAVSNYIIETLLN